MSDIRTEVHWFADQMEKRLKANESKRSWKHLTMQQMFRRLVHEVEELRHTGHCGCELCGKPTGVPDRQPLLKEVIHEAADVANYAMMIADLALTEMAKEQPKSEPQAAIKGKA